MSNPALLRNKAIVESKVRHGDNVIIAYQWQKPVTVTVKERNEKGEVIAEKEMVTHCNTWLIKKAESFRKDPRGEVVKKHPDLAPAYGTLAAARKFAEARWPENKAEEERFIAMTKDILAAKIEQGKNLPSPKILETKDLEKQPALEKKSQASKPERGR